MPPGKQEFYEQPVTAILGKDSPLCQIKSMNQANSILSLLNK